jgi:hypothetical protein
MTTLIEAAKQALEALKTCDGGKSWADPYQRFDKKMVDKAITALRTAIAEAEKPVAWVNHGENIITRVKGWDGYGALYAAPPAAQPAPVPSSWVETVAVNLVREGINKHKARELAAHFHGLAHQPAAQQKPVGEMKDSQIIEGMVVPVVPVELPAGTKLYAAPVQEPLGYWNAVEGWVELPEEAHKPKWPLKYQWVNGRGYVVWRDVFEGNMKCPLDEAIAAHAQAVFVDEGDAKEYCTFKNTAPPAQRQPLTEERVWELAANCLDSVAGRLQFVRAIEAAHGITGEKS